MRAGVRRVVDHPVSEALGSVHPCRCGEPAPGEVMLDQRSERGVVPRARQCGLVGGYCDDVRARAQIVGGVQEGPECGWLITSLQVASQPLSVLGDTQSSTTLVAPRRVISTRWLTWTSPRSSALSGTFIMSEGTSRIRRSSFRSTP